MDDPTSSFEAYAATLQQVMTDAIQQAEALQAEANADREAAFADKDKMQDLLRQLENQAQRKAEDDLHARYGQLKEEMIASVIRKLKDGGKTEEEIEGLRKALEGSR